MKRGGYPYTCMNKENLAEVFDETLDIIRKSEYENNKGEKIDLDTTILEEGTAFYQNVPNMTHTPGQRNYKTQVVVLEKDTFEAAKELGEHCGVLNMASFSRPGGGVLKGSSAQEEELCRRSNLYLSLSYYHNQDYEHLYEACSDESSQYPIPVYGGIYSPNVTVFRGLDYELLEKPFHCNVISVPAVKKPRLTKNGDMEERETKMMKGKIRTMLRIAILHSLKDLVLGAFGCGSYGCPASQTAKLFKDILRETEFKGRFEKIVFAIIEDKNSNGKNLNAFKEVFG